jgi:hypothetical protein
MYSPWSFVKIENFFEMVKFFFSFFYIGTTFAPLSSETCAIKLFTAVIYMFFK